MSNIRKAEAKDLSRIAEILVFAKRIKYRPIFNNDDYSFNELQVVKLVEEYGKPKILDNIWVYDDGIVKGMIHIEGKEIVELYVDYFFWSQGIGAKLIEFAKEKHNGQWFRLSALHPVGQMPVKSGFVYPTGLLWSH